MKIPNIAKFRGDNKQSWITWVEQFEAHAKALGIENTKWRDILLCSTESTAFSFIAGKISDDNTISYNNLKIELKRRFFGDDYRRTLQNKFRELVFKKGTVVNTFIDQLTQTIRELFDIDERDTINSIAMNHVISNLEEDMRQDAKIFQLSGNKSLENLLEFVVTKMEGNSLQPKFESNISYGTVPMATGGTDDRLDKLEKMMHKMFNKIDNSQPNFNKNTPPSCSYCGKVGHAENKCFKKKKCYSCGKSGHIAKFCLENKHSIKPEVSVTSLENTDPNMLPARRTIVNVEIGGKHVDLLYDTGSQFSIITKQTYDSLPIKPPLMEVKQSGIGIDGHRFQFEGVAYLTINFKKSDGTDYPLFYEPVLVSRNVKSNILGAKTESRFKICIRDLDNQTLVYTTRQDERVVVKCYKEQLNITSAYIEVARTSVIFDNEVKMVKGRIVDRGKFESKIEGDDLFSISGCPEYNGDESFTVSDLTIKELKRRIMVPVENISGKNLTLKKGDICAEINVIRESEIKIDQACSYIPELKTDQLRSGQLNLEEKNKLENILSNYDLEVKSTPISKSKIPYNHEINLTDDIPVVTHPRVIPHSKKQEVYEQIEKMLKDEIIQPSDSPYSSAIVPVVKKDGSIRMCVDYRKLNAKTIPKSYPIPRHEDLFDDFVGAEVFTVLDLSSAYWHIPLREEDKEKSAFVLPKGKYEWLVMPFGLRDAAFSLSYVMDNILKDFEKAKSFFDDCILYGKRVDHLDLLRNVLEKFAEYGIHINYKKCQFMVIECSFVGHVVNNKGVKPQPSKISDIVDFNKPNNIAELRTFLGMVAYCRKFIKDFSDQAACLFDLLKKGKKFLWSDECESCFAYLKEQLRNAELLVHPNFEKPFILTTDASNKAIGFTLFQEVEGDLLPILYGGRALTKAEKNYCTTDKELLGCYFAVQKCEFYLLGNEYAVYTDHEPLEHFVVL